MGEFEDDEPSEDEWDEWDMDVEADYEEPGDADFEDCGWKNLLKHKGKEETDLPHDEAPYAEPGDSDFEDRPWKDLLGKGKTHNDDLPADDSESQLSDGASDEAANTEKAELSADDEDPPTMHKIGRAIMEQTGLAMSDLPE